MIGPLFVVLLSGAHGAPPALEAWDPAMIQLMPAQVVTLEAAETLAGLLPAEGAEPAVAAKQPGAVALEQLPVAPGHPDANLMPLRLERAVVSPAP